MYKIYLLLCLLPCILVGRQIETFYGAIEVEEPVLLELIDSPAFQRLKSIHQYGVAYYTTHREEYNRYDHSIGVFTILRLKGASLEEQIAGLLHDVSHTAFSHVGDWIFAKENQVEDYQNSIHLLFLQQSGLEEILNKYNFTAHQVLPKEELFPALENKLPNLCADRIDYNIQGAYYQGFITYEEALSIFQDIQFVNPFWVSTNVQLMKKLVRFSLFMTQNCWGSPINYMTSRALADALLRGIELEIFSYDDLHFGTDDAIWEKLTQSEDAIIQEKMHQVMQPHLYFCLVDLSGADWVIKSKFRGIDPWVAQGPTCVRVTSIDPDLKREYERVKSIMEMGWGIIVV